MKSRPNLPFGMPQLTGLVVLLVLAVWGLANIEKNTSPFFLDKTHPVRADHIAQQDVFSRAGYSTYALIRVHEGADIYHNALVALLQDLHVSVEGISLIEQVNHESLYTRFDVTLNSYGKAFSTLEEARELYNLLIRVHESDEVRLLLGQYVFPVKSVKSLINSDNIYEQNEDLIVESNYQRRIDWDEASKQVIANNDLLRGALYSDDQRGLLLQIEYAIDDEFTNLNTAMLAKIKSAVQAAVASRTMVASVHYAGGPVLNSALSEVMERDNARYFPLVILFVLATLSLFYRSLRCAMFGLSIAVMSIVCTLALMPVFGITLNIVTTILPVFIITIAVTDAIHVMSAVRTSTARSNSQAVNRAIKNLFRPMLLTSITTGIGFLSLSFTKIENIYGFGVMVAVSVVIAFVLSVTLLPHMLRVWPIQRTTLQAGQNNTGAGTRVFISYVAKKRWPAMICLAVTISVASMGLLKLEVNQASIESFDVDSEMRSDNRVFKETGSGSVALGIWFKGHEEGAMLKPEMLRLMQDIQELASSNEVYVDSLSIVDFLQHLHTVLEGNGVETLDFSETERVRQYLFLLEGGAERDLDSVVTMGDYKQAKLSISLETDSSASIKVLLSQIDQALEQNLPAGVDYTYTGYGALTHAAANEVFISQLNSLLTSFALIYLIFLAVFRSLSTAIIGMLPLLATLATMFGLMGLLGFPLDIGSTLIAGIAFGIGIDYSIHFIEALRREPFHQSRQVWIERALGNVTMPIGISAIVLSAGFSILLLSGFKPLATLGLLVMVSMLVSALFTLVILPQILQIVPERIYRSTSAHREIPKALSPVLTKDEESIVLERSKPPISADYSSRSVSSSEAE